MGYVRLNKAQAVGLVVIFLANLKESHMIATKRIFMYLKGTKEYVLWYPHKGNFEPNIFMDVDRQGTQMIERAQLEVHSFLEED